ncbi:hypothetical protein BGZ82_003651 [Podila clonocystis]|nr:hypothetical protein BGZ82_003651 [Podila clonocystis]
MDTSNNPPSLNSHPPNGPPSIHTTAPLDAITTTHSILSSIGSNLLENALEQVADEGQSDATDDVSDDSFLGFTKKDIDDESKKFMDELLRTTNSVELCLSGYYGHGDNDSDMEQHSNNDNERSMPNAPTPSGPDSPGCIAKLLVLTTLASLNVDGIARIISNGKDEPTAPAL